MAINQVVGLKVLSIGGEFRYRASGWKLERTEESTGSGQRLGGKGYRDFPEPLGRRLWWLFI